MRTANRLQINSSGRATGRWTSQEHEAFLQGLELHGREVRCGKSLGFSSNEPQQLFLAANLPVGRRIFRPKPSGTLAGAKDKCSLGRTATRRARF